MADKPASHTLADEKLALSLFLDSLLREPELQTTTQPAAESGETQTISAPAQPLTRETPDEPQIQQQLQPAPEQAPDTQTAIEEEAAVPDWAQQPFQALLFKVAGLTLAVPLQSLNGVLEWPGSLTEMPGHADFYLGILQHHGSSVPVMDTARLVFPRDKLKQLAGDDPLQRISRIVLINQGRWGLACDEVAEVITLSADQIRWRSQRTQRRWLLGTVVDHMCALLDTDVFAERLHHGED